MKYRLKETAKNHHVRRQDGTVEKVEPGEVVELDEAQARAFADKFERVSGKTSATSKPRRKPGPKPKPKPED